MILASPVWKKAIYPPRTESSASNKPGSNPLFTPTSSVCSSDTSTRKHLDFSEDDGQALALLLRIVHLRFDKILTSVSSNLLLQLAKLGNRYLCSRVLKPWVLPWILTSEQEGLESLGKESWLFIYLVFRKKAELFRVFEELIREVKVDKCGKYITARGQPLEAPIPPQVFGKEHFSVGRSKD